MSNTIKSKINFALAKIKRVDSKFRITQVHTTNDTYNKLAFGNNFNILTKIDPNLALTFTIVDEINDKLIMSYNENVIHINVIRETPYFNEVRNRFLSLIF